MTTQKIRESAGWIYDRIRDAGLDPDHPIESIDVLVMSYIRDREGEGQ